MKENEIDSMIREALSKEDAACFESVGGEQSPFAEAMSLFQGRSRWLVYGSIMVMLFLMVVAVFAAIKFLDTGRVREMILWGAVCFFALSGVSAIKIWSWMEMSKNAIRLEIKRLELQVAYVTTSIAELTELIQNKA